MAGSSRKIAVRLVVLCYLVAVPLHVAGQTNAAPAGQATGERIGNAISAIISTAFPAVDKVLNAIWPDRGQKKNAADAQTAAKKAHDDAMEQQKASLSALQKAAADLATVRTFLSHCVVAEERVSSMRAILDDSPKEPSADQAARLRDAWLEASARIEALKGDEIKKRIESMDDVFVRTTLHRVADANYGKIEAIREQLKESRWPGLRASLAELQPNLSAVAALSGELISNFSTMLATLPEKLQGTKNASLDEESARASKDFRKRLAAQYPDIK